MTEINSELLRFDEDDFNLDAYKKTAASQARHISLNRGTRRRVAFYKFLIILTAFVAAYLLYTAASEAIMRYDYNKYHRAAD